MKDLPHNIWSQITSHLPDNEVKLLYAVNRALFDIAMNLRYEEVMISADPDEWPKGNDIRLFLRSPLCQRPKSLRIQLCSILSEKPEPKSLLKRLRQSVIKSIQKYTHNSKLDHVAELTRVAVEVMPHLNGVENLRILACNECCTSAAKLELEFHESDQSTLLMRHVWDHFKPQLRRVEITCPIELATQLQLPSSSQLNSLQKFSFKFFSLEIDPSHKNGNPSHGEILSRTVVPFLKGHQRTLRDVSFRPVSRLVLDTSPILQCLQDMPPLDRIQIGFLFLSMKETPFHGHPVLRAHRDSLKSLTLYFKTCFACLENQGPSFFCQDWCLVDLPHLTNLTLLTPQMSFSPSFANYVRQFANSLVSLTIPYNLEFEYLEAKEFCKTLVEFRSLRHLNLSVRGFSPSTLAQFAGVLPRLRSLILNYKFICPYQDNRDYVPTLLPRLFQYEMMRYKRRFSTWELESLAYQANIYTGPCTDDHPYLTEKTKKPLVDYLPGVQQFCHFGREEFLQLERRDFSRSKYDVFDDY